VLYYIRSKENRKVEIIMVKTMVVLSPAQASALLTAYHTLDEITDYMEQHDLEDSETYGYALDAMDGLGHVLEDGDTIWKKDVVVLREEK
jgi:hypothetical protein